MEKILGGFMFKALLFVLAISLILGSTSFTPQKKDSFAPENSMWIGADEKAGGGITLEDFNRVIDSINLVYAPIVKARGAKLVFQRNWDDGTVNAYAKQSGKNWIVAMFGGLARFDIMTPDGFALVVCHELAHHLGGAPKTSVWASNEGQSDYVGTMKCMREIFKKEKNSQIISKMSVDSIVSQKCKIVYKVAEQASTCMRIAMAGKVLADVLNRLDAGQKEVSFKTPDTHQVTRTDNSHPQAQCRLDTYFAGALCDKDLSQKLSDKDPLLGTCNSSQGAIIGTRPLCWYKP